MEKPLVIGMVSGYSDPLSLEKNYCELEELVKENEGVDLLSFGELFLLRDILSVNPIITIRCI